MHPPRVTYDRVPIHRGTVFAVERVSFRDDTGREIVRDVVRHPGAVTVIPVLDDGRLVMIRNWRVAVGAWLDEFCAGKLEPGEDPALAAARELRWKTLRIWGIRRASWRPCFRSRPPWTTSRCWP
ncbi:MAG: NUDIX hydrolase [Phenylobacterium sp.]